MKWKTAISLTLEPKKVYIDLWTYIVKNASLWTRIFHVRPHFIGETCFYMVKNFSFGKVGVATYFI